MSELDPSHGKIEISCQVACDECGNWFLGLRFPKAKAIKELRAEGWKKRRGLWICPFCIAEAHDAKVHRH